MELATDVADRAVSSLEGAGVFAAELFLTEDGQVVSHFPHVIRNLISLCNHSLFKSIHIF